MSRRKRYRKLRNKVVVTNLRLFAQNKARHRAEIEAEKANQQLMRARLLFETFKSDLCSEARTPPQVIAEIEAFKDVIKKVVKDKYIRLTILKEIHFAEVKFIAAFGPKSQEQMNLWKKEARGIRTTMPPPGPANPENN